MHFEDSFYFLISELTASMKKFLPFICIIIGMGGLFVYLLYSLDGRTLLENWQANQLGVLVLTIFTGSLLVWVAYYYVVSLLRWQRSVGLRFGLSFFLLWALMSLCIYLFALQIKEWAVSSALFPPDSMQVFLVKGATVSLLMSLLFTLGDFSWFVYYRYIFETLARLRNERKQKELQFQMLRSQLTPHFLFNSLNTASNLTSYEPVQAEKFLRSLAASFTFLLEQSKDPLNSLQKELEIVDNFFHLMQVRFGQKIMLEQEIEPDCLNRQLPTLALQLLVENALKHNVATAEDPVRIYVKATKEGVLVLNNATTLPEQVSSRGIGLKNLQERYQHLSNKQLAIFQSSNRFEVRLPYIYTKQQAHV